MYGPYLPTYLPSCFFSPHLLFFNFSAFLYWRNVSPPPPPPPPPNFGSGRPSAAPPASFFPPLALAAFRVFYVRLTRVASSSSSLFALRSVPFRSVPLFLDFYFYFVFYLFFCLVFGLRYEELRIPVDEYYRYRYHYHYL